MAITEFSKNYHEKMFPKYHSAFLETDPEFIERFDNFAFDEVVNSDDLDENKIYRNFSHTFGLSGRR